LNDSDATIELVSPTGLTSSTIDSTGTSAVQVSDSSGFTLSSANPTGGQTVLATNTTYNAVANTVAFNLGTVSNSNYSGSTPNYAIIEFNALVTNVATSRVGAALTTTSTITGSNASSGSVSDTINVVEPNVSITKTITAINESTGAVTWQDVVANNGDTTAYDVSLSDVSNSTNQGDIFGLTESSGTNLNVTSGSVASTTHTLAATFDLAVGKSETFTYETTVTGGVPDTTATVTYQSLNEKTAVNGTSLTYSGGNISFYGSSYGTGTSSFDTSPGFGTSGSSTGARNGTTTPGTLNNYDANTTIGIGLVDGTVWNDIGDPLNVADESLVTGVGLNQVPDYAVATELNGVTVTATWSGQTSASTIATNGSGSYALLLPDTVAATISTPATSGTGANQETLVYSTSNSTTFSHSESGLTSSAAEIVLTPTGGSTVGGINYAYRLPDTAPVISENATTTVASWGNTTVADNYIAGGSAVTLSTGATASDTQLNELVTAGLGDYSGGVLTIARNGGAVSTDQFIGSGLLTLSGGARRPRPAARSATTVPLSAPTTMRPLPVSS
jgi:hypothetical protein